MQNMEPEMLDQLKMLVKGKLPSTLYFKVIYIVFYMCLNYIFWYVCRNIKQDLFRVKVQR